MRDKNTSCIVCEVHGVPAGFLIVELDYPSKDIIKLAVYPGFRRRGIARELLLEVEEGDYSIECWVAEKELEAQLFLARNGFNAVNDVEAEGIKLYLFRRGWRFAEAPDLKYRMKNVPDGPLRHKGESGSGGQGPA